MRSAWGAVSKYCLYFSAGNEMIALLDSEIFAILEWIDHGDSAGKLHPIVALEM